MSLIEVFFIAVGLSMDAFAVSICKGLSLGKINVKHMCIAGAWFGGFQAIMPLIGYLFGTLFADVVTKWSHWIAFALLVIIGGNMIKEAVGNDEDEVDDSMNPATMFMLAVATSIDALAVGVSFAFMRVNIALAVILIGVTTFGFSAAGIKIGSLFGTRYKSKAEITGGIVLIIIGLKIVFEGLGIL